MKYNIEKYTKDVNKRDLMESLAWLVILFGCGVFAWLFFEFAMLITSRPSLFN